jgi:hypothetical protein
MNKTFVALNIFRGILLASLLFRWFFLSELNSYTWDVISYSLLAFGLGGMIILEIVIFFHKRNRKHG